MKRDIPIREILEMTAVLLGIIAVAILFFSLAGCSSLPPEIADKIEEKVAPYKHSFQIQPEPEAPAADIFGALRFCWGGFNGAGASPVAGCTIDGLAVSSSGISYKWSAGGCEMLGAASRSDASCLACLFCEIGGEWRGGKFDWISTSRTTRSFTNVKEGYHGWDPAAIGKATRYAFVIISNDGKRRTNVTVAGKN